MPSVCNVQLQEKIGTREYDKDRMKKLAIIENCTVVYIIYQNCQMKQTVGFDLGFVYEMIA